MRRNFHRSWGLPESTHTSPQYSLILFEMGGICGICCVRFGGTFVVGLFLISLVSA